MVELTVCIGTSCHLRGSEKVVKTFQRLIHANELDKKVNLKGTFCMGKCSEENVNVSVNEETFDTTPEDAESFFLKKVITAVK